MHENKNQKKVKNEEKKVVKNAKPNSENGDGDKTLKGSKTSTAEEIKATKSDLEEDF